MKSHPEKKIHKAIPLKKPEGIYRRNWSLLLILVVAAAFRFWHIGWSLPEVYEEAYPFYKAWNMWNWGKIGLDLNPHFFNYPGFTIYLNFILQGVHYVVGSMAGNFSSLDAFRQAFQNDPSVSLILSRIVQVVFDLGTIILLYQWGVLLKHRGVGIVAAVLAALNPLMIKQAHQVTVDTPLAFFVLAALYCMYRVALGDGMRWYMLAGLCIGLASASKYTGAMLLPVLLFGHYLNYEREKSLPARAKSWKLFFGAAGIAAGVFVLFNPFIFLSYGEFIRALTYEQLHMATGHLGIEQSTPTIVAYALYMIPGACGWITTILVAVSIVVLLSSGDKKNFLLLCFPVAYLTVIFTWQMRADRYLLPAIPILLLACSLVAAGLWDRIYRRTGSKAMAYLVAVGAATVVLFEPVNSAMRYHEALSLPDTRSVAKEWIEKNIDRSSVIAMTPVGTRMFPPGIYTGFTLPFNPVNPGLVRYFYDTRWYEDFDYIIASDYDLARYEEDTIQYEPFIRFFRTLQSRWTLVREIQPRADQPGPVIWLYRPPEGRKDSVFSAEMLVVLNDYPPDQKTFVRYLQTMTLLLMTRGAYPKAEQLVRILIAVNGDGYLPHKVLTHCLEERGKYSEAMEAAEVTLRLHPNDPDMLTTLGSIYLKTGRPAESEHMLLEAIHADSRFRDAYELLSQLYVGRKDIRRAIEILSQYHSMLPSASPDAQRISARIKELSRLP